MSAPSKAVSASSGIMSAKTRVSQYDWMAHTASISGTASAVRAGSRHTVGIIFHDAK
jgi:hypothetical protein